MGSRAWVSLILALACCGAIVTSGGAAAPRPQPVVVARDGATTLAVEESGDNELCLSIAGTGPCVAPAGGIVVIGAGEGDDQLYAGVAITATAVRVEIRRAGALLGSAATVDAGAYTGPSAATLRFALVPVPMGTRADGVRAHGYDARGALVAAVAGGPDSALVFDRRRVLAGRAGRAHWSIVSNQTSRLTPALFDLAHESVSRCVEVEVASGGAGGDSFITNGGICLSDEPRDRLQLIPGFGAEPQVDDQCTPNLRLVHGVLDASVTRVTALLGDGTRRRARIGRLPGRDERVYALAIPRTHALRSVQLRSRSGRTHTTDLRTAPLAVVCADAENTLGTISLYAFDSLADVPGVTPAGDVTTIPGNPAMRVADGPGDTLCIAVGAVPFNGLGCAIVGPLDDEVLRVGDNLRKSRSVALAVPASVALVRLTAGGRTVREIPTVAAPGYAGRYAGLVRFAAASADLGKVLGAGGAEYLDAAGHLLYRERDPSSNPTPRVRVLPDRRIAGRAGAPSLWQSTVRYGSSSVRCVLITPGPRPGPDASCRSVRGRATVLLDAPCSTHRLTVAVAATPGLRAFAVTGSGRQPIALRGGAGILTLPSGALLRTVQFVRNGRTTRVGIDAPPARSQCGWTFEPRI